MHSASDLVKAKCKPCEGGMAKLSDAEVENFLKKLTGWQRQGDCIIKTYKFRNYYETIAFVNLSAWISHREDHHPDLTVGYRQCTVRYTTHAIDGLSENDFICAAKTDAALAP